VKKDEPLIEPTEKNVGPLLKTTMILSYKEVVLHTNLKKEDYANLFILSQWG